MIFLAKNGRRIEWVLVCIVGLPTCSFLFAYSFHDFWMLPNLMSSGIPIIAGAYRRVGELYPTTTFAKYMKINLLINALLYVPSLSAIHISYASTYYTANLFEYYWLIILFLFIAPPTIISIGIGRHRLNHLIPILRRWHDSVGDVPSAHYMYYSKNILFGCLFGGIGGGISLLLYFGRTILTLPILEILGIALFVASIAVIILTFLGMLAGKGNPEKKDFEESGAIGRHRQFKERERNKDYRTHDDW